MTDLREALERAVEQIGEYREGLPEVTCHACRGTGRRPAGARRAA